MSKELHTKNEIEPMMKILCKHHGDKLSSVCSRKGFPAELQIVAQYRCERETCERLAGWVDQREYCRQKSALSFSRCGRYICL
jgi:hypothetical protein